MPRDVRYSSVLLVIEPPPLPMPEEIAGEPAGRGAAGPGDSEAAIDAQHAPRHPLRVEQVRDGGGDVVRGAGTLERAERAELLELGRDGRVYVVRRGLSGREPECQRPRRDPGFGVAGVLREAAHHQLGLVEGGDVPYGEARAELARAAERRPGVPARGLPHRAVCALADLRTVPAWDKGAQAPSVRRPDPDWTRGVSVSSCASGEPWIDDLVSLRDRPAVVLNHMHAPRPRMARAS